MKRAALVAGALVCAGLAVGLFLLAADVARWSEAMAKDDVRYRRTPADDDLWQAETLLPLDPARKMLGLGDDVGFREAVRALRLGALDKGFSSDPAIELRRAEARARLQEIAGGSSDPRRRSRAMSLLGVINFASALSEAQGQDAYLADATAAFRGAIELDSDNAEAKANLELALQKGQSIQPTESAGGPNPSPGGSGAQGAGAGSPGSGY